MKVSAICPTYNRRRYISKAIASFLSQTLQDSELIIIDDGIDSIVDLIPDNPRVRYIHLEGPRRSIGEKRNLGCEQAKGEFIVHWDDDDWSSVTRLEREVNLLESSGKSVLTYYNLLYWDALEQRAYRYNVENATPSWKFAHGATFCYKKSYWQEHEFEELFRGEDSYFAKSADKRGQLISADSEGSMVLIAHGENIYRPPLGRFPIMKTDDLPSQFLKDNEIELPKSSPSFIESASTGMTAKDDLIIGGACGYDWDALRSYAISLHRTGFQGTKLLFVNDITNEARANLLSLGFQLVDFELDSKLANYQVRIYKERFQPAINYLSKHRQTHRYVLWTDVRDLIFQTDPSSRIESVIGPNRLLAAGECWKIKDELYNDKWLRQTVDEDAYKIIRNEEVCCMGTLAGDAEMMYHTLLRIQEVFIKSPVANDQAALNWVLRQSPFKEVTKISRMNEGLIVTCAAFDTESFSSWASEEDIPLVDEVPKFDLEAGIVYTPNMNIPFSIVHQYDRDPTWGDMITERYKLGE